MADEGYHSRPSAPLPAEADRKRGKEGGELTRQVGLDKVVNEARATADAQPADSLTAS